MNGTILVTGGSRGIGAAAARAAAKAGYGVIITYQREVQRAGALVDELCGFGVAAYAVQADVAREADIVRVFAAVDAQAAPLGGLVNSAGILGPAGRVDALDAAGIQEVLATNIAGTLLCAREAIRRMSTTHGGKGGSIVNLSSAAARLGAPGAGVVYAASKGAIDSLTFGLAQEVAAEGIRVNAVSPGVIDTDMQPAGRVEAIGPHLPMRRAGRADEVAEAILWLLGDKASYVSGTVIDVSGAR